MSDSDATRLLREIIACPNLETSRQDARLPCHEIVASQANPNERFQLPEPWSGFLDAAPILFVGSNPSISYSEAYPLDSEDWSTEKAARFFTHRFHDGWVRDGRYGRFRNGDYATRRTSYWSSARQRAMELLQRNVTPGEDYCMTEIVHCKSKGEIGVRAAATECTRLYLRRILEASGAKVVIAMGTFAAAAAKATVHLDGSGPVLSPASNEPFRASFVFVPHPAAFAPKTFRRLLGDDDLGLLQARLRA